MQIKMKREIPWLKEQVNPDLLYEQIGDSEEFSVEFAVDDEDQRNEEQELGEEPRIFEEYAEDVNEIDNSRRFWSWD